MLHFALLILLLAAHTVSGTPITPPHDFVQRDDGDNMCYNRCYGIDRSRALDAIDWFCSAYAGTDLHYNIADGNLAISDNYTYMPSPESLWTPGYYEEGVIWMSMGFYFDGPNKNDICDSFYDGYDVEYWRCRWGLTSAIDGCNTNGENWKQGGRFRGDCFQFYLNPNPIEPCTRMGGAAGEGQ